MPRYLLKLTGSKPDENECRTEFVTDNLSRCLANKSKCRYSFPADSGKTYCMHKNHGNFRVRFHRSSPMDRPEVH
jgi:hypothetical protein